MLKEQKGITLVALVITIIVLLILAAISIAMLTGDEGVLVKANQAKTDNQLGAVKDKVGLVAINAVSDYYEDTIANGNGEYSDTGIQTAVFDAIEAIEADEITPVTIDTTTDNTVVLSYNGRKTTGTVAVGGGLTWTGFEKAE